MKTWETPLGGGASVMESGDPHLLLRAFEQMPFGVVVTDLQGSMVYVNRTATEISGYTRQELLGRNPRIFKSGNMPHSLYRTLYDTVRSGKVWQADVENRRKDGILAWERLTISPLRSPDGTIRYFVGIKEPLTLGRRVEDDNFSNAQRLRFIIERIPVSMAILRVDGIVDYMNPHAQELFGLEQAPPAGKSILDLLPPSVGADTIAFYHADWPADSKHRIEHPLRSDGSGRRIVAVEGAPIPGKAGGEQKLVFFSNVSRQRLTERLSHSFTGASRLLLEEGTAESQLGAVCGQLAEGLPVTRVAIYQVLPVAAQKPWAKTIARWDGKGLRPATPWSETPFQDSLFANLLKTLAGGREFTRAPNAARDNQPDPLDALLHSSGIHSVLLSPILVDGILWGILSFEDDQDGHTWNPLEIAFGEALAGNIGLRIKEGFDTERLRQSVVAMEKAVRQAELADQSKSGYIAMISHEIRTPLSGIVGMAGILADTPLNEEQQDYVDTIRTSSNSLLALINDVLDLSKIEAGRFEVEASPFDLPGLLQEISSLFRPWAKRENLSFEYEADPNLPRQIEGDRTRLQQILSNLISNAIKFTEKGFVRLRVGTVSRNPLRCLLRFEVEDSGMGIPEKVKDRIFSTYAQADSSISRRYGGTGLGLVISKQLCELLGGKISFESEEGRGTVFRVEIPFPVLGAAPVEQKPAAGDPEKPGVNPAETPILVVEDNPVNQKVIMLQLRKLGYQPDLAQNGLEALVKTNETDYHVILMDCQMPEMDGYEAARQIMRHHSENGGAAPYIIALTAAAMEGDRERAIEAGMSAYLSKPAPYTKLKAEIEKGAAQRESWQAVS